MGSLESCWCGSNSGAKEVEQLAEDALPSWLTDNRGGKHDSTFILPRTRPHECRPPPLAPRMLLQHTQKEGQLLQCATAGQTQSGDGMFMNRARFMEDVTSLGPKRLNDVLSSPAKSTESNLLVPLKRVRQVLSWPCVECGGDLWQMRAIWDTVTPTTLPHVPWLHLGPDISASIKGLTMAAIQARARSQAITDQTQSKPNNFTLIMTRCVCQCTSSQDRSLTALN
ncbi:unnamed protein product [Leuciscus chuanchicus]